MNLPAILGPLLRLSEHSTEALFTSAWQAGLLLAAVAIALRLLPRLTAATRSLLWTVALLVIAALPFLPARSATIPALATHAPVLHLNPAWSLAVAAVWLTLSLYRAAQLIASATRLRTIRDISNPVAGVPAFDTNLPFGLTRTAVLCTSQQIARPSVIGFFSPRILIPAHLFPKLSAGEIDHIVLHELEHLRRGDDWRNLLQKTAVMLFPLNPALLWIERRLCFERELACDESVLAQTQAPRSYAACLVHLAEESRLGRQLSLALGAWERRSELGPPRPRHPRKLRPDVRPRPHPVPLRRRPHRRHGRACDHSWPNPATDLFHRPGAAGRGEANPLLDRQLPPSRPAPCPSEAPLRRDDDAHAGPTFGTPNQNSARRSQASSTQLHPENDTAGSSNPHLMELVCCTRPISRRCHALR